MDGGADVATQLLLETLFDIKVEVFEIHRHSLAKMTMKKRPRRRRREAEAS